MMNKDHSKAHFGDNYYRPLVAWKRVNKPKFDKFSNNFKLYIEEGLGVDLSLNFDEKLKEFYAAIEGWEVKWTLKPELDIDIEGSINILPIKSVLIGDVDFYPDKFPRMKNFTLLDYFYDERAVGFYLDKPEQGLFFFEFDSRPQKVSLNFHGYLEMLKYTKGAADWHYLLTIPDSKVAQKALREMNKLDPEFTKEGFFELYNSVRIDK